MRPIAVGDRVRYSAKWLRNTGQYTGPVCSAKGTVTALEPFGVEGRQLATIAWERKAPLPPRVLDVNLSILGAREAD